MKRITEYDTVVIALPDGVRLRDASFACRVMAKTGATVALEPLEKVKAVSLPDRVPDAFMIFRYDNALVALKGVLVQQGSVGDLRFKVTDGVEHGKSSRTKICLPVALRHPEAEGEATQALSVDLSADGLVVQCPLAAGVGTQLEATLSLPGSDEPIQAIATVIEASEGRLELALDAGDRVARARLARFVLESNRANVAQRGQFDRDDLDF